VISILYKFIFVHIPKTGGISIADVIERFSLPLRLLDGDDYWTDVHGKYYHYIERFGQAVWDEFYKFSFVRNPWARLSSAFFYLSKGGNNPYDKKLSNMYLKKYNGDFEFFVKDFIYNDKMKHLFHLHPQHEFICDETGRLLVDFVGRFENLQEDFNKVCDKFNVPHIELSQLNKTQYRKAVHYTEYYSIETRDIVAEKYRKDIEIFDYRFK